MAKQPVAEQGNDMKTKSSWASGAGWLLSVLGLLLFSAQAVRADEGDPPSRVARISYTDGPVSFQPGGQGDWGTAQRNASAMASGAPPISSK